MLLTFRSWLNRMNTVLAGTSPSRAGRRKQVSHAGGFRSRTRIDGLQQLESKILLANFTVSIADDENDGNFAANDLSLREAVAQVNSLAGPDTITFNSGLGTLTLTAGQLEITSDINVVGLGIDNTVISGNLSSRIFNVQSTGALTLSGARLQNGQEFSGAAAIQN